MPFRGPFLLPVLPRSAPSVLRAREKDAELHAAMLPTDPEAGARLDSLWKRRPGVCLGCILPRDVRT